ncbi:hypothetical protein SNE40_021480 [Patella caerulea]|uniref:Transcription termination factor 3, mitochondrial n=1 Tax=Patella caerulea TaxID=87958 RepID=A0AAN8GCP7_PATCE
MLRVISVSKRLQTFDTDTVKFLMRYNSLLRCFTTSFSTQKDESRISYDFDVKGNNSEESRKTTLINTEPSSGPKIDYFKGIHGNKARLDETTENKNQRHFIENNPYNFEEQETGLESVTDEPVSIKEFKPVFNLAALVNESDTLQKLLKIGVDLSAIEKYKGMADLIVKLDFDKDVMPYLLFLKDCGVHKYGSYLAKNPLIFKQSLEDLQVRVTYLESKKFSKESIARIVLKAPLFLSLPVKTVDKKLGYLQKQFNLTGNEVRQLATMIPKIITWRLNKIQENTLYYKEFLGFTDVELKKILMTYPKVFLMDRHGVGKKFDFLHNVMGLDHKRLLEWPAVFGTRLFIINHRHRYLLKVKRAQYDPEIENYVSLQALCSCNDREFCENVAKTSEQEYDAFLKCL